MHIDDGLIPDPWTSQQVPRAEAEALEAFVLASGGGEAEDDPFHAEWLKLKNSETEETAWLRLRREIGGDTFTVIGVAVLPSAGGERLTNQSVRSISFPAVEKALDESRSAGKIEGYRSAHLLDKDWEPMTPLGGPREHKDFYARVGAQFAAIENTGAKNVLMEMSEISGRPLKTVQGWVTEARKRGFLPPGKPGRNRNG